MTIAEKPLPLGTRQEAAEPEQSCYNRKDYPTVEDMVDGSESEPNIIRGRE